jgi:hypothetical protein
VQLAAVCCCCLLAGHLLQQALLLLLLLGLQTAAAAEPGLYTQNNQADMSHELTFACGKRAYAGVSSK